MAANRFNLPLGAVELPGKRTRNAKHFALPERGKYVAVFAPDLHFEASPGVWEDLDLAHRAQDGDLVVDKASVASKVGPSGFSIWSRATGKGITFAGKRRHTLPEKAKASATARAILGDGPWDIRRSPRGSKATLKVWSKLGPKTYEFHVTMLGGAKALEVDAGGNLVSGSDFKVIRPHVVTATGEEIQCSAWSISGKKASFSFDDSALPVEAFPYEIDPSTQFDIAAGANDSSVWRSGSTVYPPNTSTVYTDTATTGGPNKWYIAPNYAVNLGMFKWDTSSLNDNVTILGASLYLNASDASSADSLNLRIEWLQWAGDTSDYACDPTPDDAKLAYLGALSGLSIGANTLTLSNYSLVNKTGYTYLKEWIPSAGAPTGTNQFLHYLYENGSKTPYLTVTYSNRVDASMSGTLESSATVTGTLNTPATASGTGASTATVTATRKQFVAISGSGSSSGTLNVTEVVGGSWESDWVHLNGVVSVVTSWVRWQQTLNNGTVTAQWSSDGTTWNTLTNGGAVPGCVNGSAPTYDRLKFRFSLTCVQGGTPPTVGGFRVYVESAGAPWRVLSVAPSFAGPCSVLLGEPYTRSSATGTVVSTGGATFTRYDTLVRPARPDSQATPVNATGLTLTQIEREVAGAIDYQIKARWTLALNSFVSGYRITVECGGQTLEYGPYERNCRQAILPIIAVGVEHTVTVTTVTSAAKDSTGVHGHITPGPTTITCSAGAATFHNMKSWLGGSTYRGMYCTLQWTCNDVAGKVRYFSITADGIEIARAGTDFRGIPILPVVPIGGMGTTQYITACVNANIDLAVAAVLVDGSVVDGGSFSASISGDKLPELLPYSFAQNALFAFDEAGGYFYPIFDSEPSDYTYLYYLDGEWVTARRRAGSVNFPATGTGSKSKNFTHNLNSSSVLVLMGCSTTTPVKWSVVNSNTVRFERDTDGAAELVTFEVGTV